MQDKGLAIGADDGTDAWHCTDGPMVKNGKWSVRMSSAFFGSICFFRLSILWVGAGD